MAGREAPTSVVQNVISALVEDPAHLQRAAAVTAAAEAAVVDAAAQALAAAEDAQVEARLDADELLKQAEEQAGDQVSDDKLCIRLCSDGSCQKPFSPKLVERSFKVCWTAKA